MDECLRDHVAYNAATVVRKRRPLGYVDTMLLGLPLRPSLCVQYTPMYLLHRPISMRARCLHSSRLWRASQYERPAYPLPEDPTPAMWQRVAQLIAGGMTAATLFYFVLVADFGEGEHCFMPVCMVYLSLTQQIRRMLGVDSAKLRAALLPSALRSSSS